MNFNGLHHCCLPFCAPAYRCGTGVLRVLTFWNHLPRGPKPYGEIALGVIQCLEKGRLFSRWKFKFSMKIVWNLEKWLFRRSEVLFFSECCTPFVGDDTAVMTQSISCDYLLTPNHSTCFWLCVAVLRGKVFEILLFLSLLSPSTAHPWAEISPHLQQLQCWFQFLGVFKHLPPEVKVLDLLHKQLAPIFRCNFVTALLIHNLKACD